MSYDDIYLNSSRTLDDVIRILGSTKEELVRISENTADLMPLPPGEYHIKIRASPIHGKGVFATKEFHAGDFIAPVRIDRKRTPVGRYLNHANPPNAEMIMDEVGDVYLVAKSLILPDTEIVTDYYFNYVNTRI